MGFSTRHAQLQRKVIDRLVTGSIRLAAERTGVVAPQVDSDALALPVVGAVV